jgi:hypothetical protein
MEARGNRLTAKTVDNAARVSGMTGTELFYTTSLGTASHTLTESPESGGLGIVQK